jgi:hypothetical protein
MARELQAYRRRSASSLSERKVSAAGVAVAADQGGRARLVPDTEDSALGSTPSCQPREWLSPKSWRTHYDPHISWFPSQTVHIPVLIQWTRSKWALSFIRVCKVNELEVLGRFLMVMHNWPDDVDERLFCSRHCPDSIIVIWRVENLSQLRRGQLLLRQV